MNLKIMFKKQKENFECENCGLFVRGNGYTNHCPKCLWSKHVDVDPGDRGALCGGMMKPKEYAYSVSEKWVTHKCIECSFERKNKISEGDSLDVLAEL